MSVYFCDTSALAKHYVTEVGSAWLRATIDPKLGPFVLIARITLVEVVSAITRKERGRHISAADAAIARHQVEQDYFGEFLCGEISETLILEAAHLAQKYALRSYDAVQLAAALQTQAKLTVRGLKPLVLLSADNHLNRAALAEGLLVEDPNNHP